MTASSDCTAPVGLPGRFRISGLPANAAQPAAQNRERGLRQSGGAHFFGNAIDELGADGPRRFRGDIARGNARSSGSDDQLHLLGQPHAARLRSPAARREQSPDG